VAVSFLIPPHSENALTCHGQGIFGLSTTRWFKILNKFVVIKKNPNMEIVSRVALDQLVFAPVGIGTYFSALTFLQGGDAEDVKKKLQTTWWGSLKMNWHFWPVVHLLNFRALYNSSEPQHEGHKAAQEIASDGTVVETHVGCARAPQAERGISVEKVWIDIHYSISE
jgi:hypothetical protein